MNKKILIIILFVMLLTGCSINEIEDYSIVAGIGIDFSENIYQVTFEIYKENNGETTELTSETISGKGNIISEAIRNITTSMNKIPYLNHCSIIILNENVVKEKFSEVINYLLHDVRIRSACYMMISKNQEAKEIFEKSQEKQKVIAYDLYKHFDLKQEIIKLWTGSKFNNILNEKINNNGTVIIPTISYEDNCDINGAYLIKSDNQYIFCENNDVFVFQLFNNCISEGLLVNENIHTYIKESKTKLSLIDNQLMVKIDMKVLSYDDIDVIQEKKYIQYLEEFLQEEINNIFLKYQKLQFDPFRVYKFLNQYESNIYSKIESEYYEYFKTLKLDTKINIDLLTLGLSEERIQ